MKLSLFGEKNKVLLVGEGNFSFAVTLLKHNLDICVTATGFENSLSKIGEKNVDILMNYGTRVLLGVDATKLEEHKILSLESFDIVVFNFPHVGGKMRIEKNRELLKNFFLSVKSVLKNDGKVFVSLCDGQGGSLADNNIRQWNNSWQITEMAAHGSFALVAVEPFDSLLFESYIVTGYRSLEKKFNTKGSITHIFKLFKKPNIENIAPKQKIELQLCDKLVDRENVTLVNSNILIIRNSESNISLFPNYFKFDITLLIDSEFNNIKLYETLYNYAGLVISSVEFLGSYKLSNLKITRTFRITYKSNQFPLYRKLVINLHENVIPKIISKYLNISVSS